MLTAGKERAGIAVEKSFAVWRKDPKYVVAYEALEEEFSRAAASMIEARGDPAVTSEIP